MKKIILLTLLAGAIALSQTAVVTIQFRGAPSPTPQILVALPNGDVKQVQIGPGLKLDLSGAVPTLSVSAASEVVGEVTKRTGDLTHVTARQPAPNTLKVYRNGLRQSEGIDYAVSGSTITFIPYYAGDVTATVTADYRGRDASLGTTLP